MVLHTKGRDLGIPTGYHIAPSHWHTVSRKAVGTIMECGLAGDASLVLNTSGAARPGFRLHPHSANQWRTRDFR